MFPLRVLHVCAESIGEVCLRSRRLVNGFDDSGDTGPIVSCVLGDSKRLRVKSAWVDLRDVFALVLPLAPPHCGYGREFEVSWWELEVSWLTITWLDARCESPGARQDHYRPRSSIHADYALLLTR